MPRLAIIATHPVQYYAPWFAQVARETDITLRVFYLHGAGPQQEKEFGQTIQWDRDLLAGYDSEVVPNRARRPDVSHPRGLWNPGIIKALKQFAPDAILLFGYAYLTAMLVLAIAAWQKWPVIFRGDSHDLGRPGTRGSRLQRLLLGRCAQVLFVGQANRRFFLARGVPPTRLHRAPHAVDAQIFDPERTDYRTAAQALRSAEQFAVEGPVVLFAGKWIAKKQGLPLARAFLAVAPTQAQLWFVGDGPDREALAAMAASDSRIKLIGFVNQSALPAYYLAADLFALPSVGAFETWGLAVNEALHMGTPVLVSDVVGCQEDLVLPGETGWVFPAGDEAELQSTLARALQGVTSRRADLGQACRQHITQFTYRQTTHGLLEALAALPTRNA